MPKKRERERERVRESERERQFNFVQITLTSGFFSVLQCPSLNTTLTLLIWQQLSFSLFKKKKTGIITFIFFCCLYLGGFGLGGFLGFFFGKTTLGCGLLNLNI